MRKIDLLKYINGELDESNSKRVSEWINSSESNRRYFYCLKESYSLMTLPEERASEADFADFLSKYNLNGNQQKSRTRNIFRSTIFRYTAAVSAAAAVILFVSLWLCNKDRTNTKYTNIIANNSSGLLLEKLPDGSIIGLSPDSEIRYSDDFNTTNRKLLLRGTCYFDVAKNKNLPFKVRPANNSSSTKSYNKAIIEVTGTKFYTSTTTSPNNLFEIALEEGSVSVKMCSNGTKEVVSLSAGDYLEVSDDLKPTKSRTEQHGNPMMDAMTDFLRFRDAKLSDIIKKISKIHNCEFKIANPKISDYLLTADLADNTLADILSIFEVTMGVRSSINENGVIELN